MVNHMKDFAKQVYKRKRWQQCRSSFIRYRQSVDGGLCQICHSDLGYIVHHKQELTPETVEDPEICYGFWNLQYVCHRCHNQEHGYFASANLFDENGDLLSPH